MVFLSADELGHPSKCLLQLSAVEKVVNDILELFIHPFPMPLFFKRINE